MGYSKLYTLNGKTYRYDFDKALVEWVRKPSKETLAADIVEGYTVIDCIGLARENWEDKEARDEHLEGWQFEIEAETAGWSY